MGTNRFGISDQRRQFLWLVARRSTSCTGFGLADAVGDGLADPFEAVLAQIADGGNFTLAVDRSSRSHSPSG